jgi:DNA polymerase III subunit gamma/tau
MTYYLKYRPQNLNDLDSEVARESLKKIVLSKNIPHAFLFSGPKGTGKTSAARIIAKIINCEKKGKDGSPCNSCEECLSITKGTNIDVIEIDAASNRGIDDIRALRDSVKLAPVRGKKKVYIIDEAHMLTLDASNALLKTLEEPPDHVVFIMATTNPEKLIKTIHSRVTEIPFKKATPDEISVSLGKIVKGEKLKIGKEILDLVSRNSDGSFRDAAKYLEQIVAEEMTDPLVIEKWITGKTAVVTEQMIKLLSKRDDRSLIEIIENVSDGGGSIKSLIDGLLGEIKASILAKSGIGKDLITEISKSDLFSLVDLLIKAEDQANISLIEQLPFEIAIIKWCEEGKTVNGEGLNINEEEEEEDEEVDGKEMPQKMASVKMEEKYDVVVEEKVSISGGELSLDDWKKVLAAVRPINTSIEALLRAAKPMSFDGRTLTLGVYYKFHKERLEENKHRKLLEEIISRVLEKDTRLHCTLAEPPKNVITESKPVEPMILKETEVLLTKKGDNDIIEMAKKMFSN